MSISSNSNKKVGNKYEAELCDLFNSKGWWSHNISQNKSGQPADIIACKDGITLLIDAKVCSKDKFLLSRIEENQHLAMRKFIKCRAGSTYLIIKIKGDDIVVEYQLLNLMMKDYHKTQLNHDELLTLGIKLEEFLNED